MQAKMHKKKDKDYSASRKAPTTAPINDLETALNQLREEKLEFDKHVSGVSLRAAALFPLRAPIQYRNTMRPRFHRSFFNRLFSERY